MQKIFVSSTFRDFQTERDYIRNVVQPKLASLCRGFSVDVSFTDLRWGIDTAGISEEQYEKKVLSVCLNEINRSKPYMIVLLGERYGYIADEAIIHNVAAQKDLRLEDERISATQLEIEYGALCEAAKNNNVFFYIRRMNCTGDSVYGPESDEAKSKLDSLKQRIIENAGEKVRYYDAYLENEKPNPEYLQKLGEDIITDIARLIKEKYSYIAEQNHFKKENLLQWNYSEEKHQAFLARRELADSIVEKLRTDGLCLGITGGTGTGKSTLFAEILTRCRDDGDTVIPFFCGSTEKTTSASEILEMLVYLLEDILGEVHLCDSKITDNRQADITSKKTQIEIYRNRLIELSCLISGSNHKLIVAVDAVDQMCADSLRNSFMFLPKNGKNVRILLTADDEKIFPKNCEIITLSELSVDEKRTVIKHILQLSGKELSEKTIHAILNKKSTGNPLYLYLLVQRLMLLQEKDYQIIYKADSAGEAIQNRLCELIETTPDDIEKITYQLFEMIKSVLPSSIRIAAESLAVSRYGLRESDIESIYKIHGEAFSLLDLVIFMNYFSELSFIRNDGRIDFLHKCVRNAILAHINDEYAVHHDIVNILDKLPTDDIVKINEFQYHTISLGLMKSYIQYISELTKRRDIDSISINARDILTSAKSNDGWIEALIRNMRERSDSASDKGVVIKNGKYESLVSIEDYVNFIYYLTFHINRNMSQTTQELNTSMKLCTYCTEVTEVLYKSKPESPDIVRVYCQALASRAETSHIMNDFKQAIEYANKAVEVWQNVYENYPGDVVLIEYIEKIEDLIVYKQDSGNLEWCKEALSESLEILSFLASVIEENNSVDFVYHFVKMHFVTAVSYYNLDRMEYCDDAANLLRDAIDFIRECKTDDGVEVFKPLEKAFMDMLVKLGKQLDSYSDSYEIMLQQLAEARKENEMYNSLESEKSLMDTLKEFSVVLMKSQDCENLVRALGYAKEAFKLDEHIHQENPSPLNTYELAEIKINIGQIFWNMHLLDDSDFILDGIAFENLLSASSYVGTMEKDCSEEEKAMIFKHQYYIYEKIHCFLLNLEEQNDLTAYFAMRALVVAEKHYEYSKTTESVVMYAKAKLNIALCKIMNGDNRCELAEGIKITTEVEELLKKGIENKSLDSYKHMLATTYLYRAQLYRYLNEKRNALSLLNKTVELSMEIEEGETLRKKVEHLLNLM